MTPLLFIACLIIGGLCGSTSVGGIILIPVVEYCTGMTLQAAAATSLASFCLTAIVGCVLHIQAKTMQKSLVIPLCIGAVGFSFFGAFAKSWISTGTLTIIFALLVIFSGVAALKNARPLVNLPSEKARFNYLLFVGCFVGFMAGLTGAGGPVLSVPMMIVAGFAPLATIAASQPFQFVAALSGSVANTILDLVDWEIAIYLFIVQSVGVWFGIWLARRINASKLKIGIAIMCILTGIYMIVR